MSTPEQGLGDSTRCVRAGVAPGAPGEPIMPGPVLAAPYHLSADEGSESDFYARNSNPTWRGLELALSQLEGEGSPEVGAAVFGTGMSAITVLMRTVLRPGDVLVMPSDGYYLARAYAAEKLVPQGIEVREVDTPAMVEAVAGARLVLAESPSNPGLDVVDLRALSAACRRAGALLAVDNTTATPLGQLPLQLGADVVVASGTKALSGHSDLLMGYLATADAELLGQVYRERTMSGVVLGPFEAWLAHRSIGSAALRLDRQGTNAAALAELLVRHPAVTDVRWPGLADDPAHAVAATQMSRFGGLVRGVLPSAEAVHALVAASELTTLATSFGGLHTTIDRRARWGDDVAPGFFRLSCGIEDTDDLVRDLTQALDSLR
ncbi:cystathionine gamma-lyase [Rhodococcus sp. X156]|uniref:cystathionine gamma-lyase n=1 Tax=Rhodococcus sp. X156 TaxID=2499145 RepID=UPI000FDA0900|nr:cystathionine gamma-lyase [Rhodococcus sp. X156]